MSDISRDYSFGGWIRELRLKQEITLRAYAEKIGMDAANLSKLERSEWGPPTDKDGVLNLIKGLDVDANTVKFLTSLAFQHHLALLRKKFEL